MNSEAKDGKENGKKLCEKKNKVKAIRSISEWKKDNFLEIQVNFIEGR